jgi:RNA polymerase sigma-70 factor (ECF subfamily)
MAFHHPAQPGGQSLTAGGEAWSGGSLDAGESDVGVPSTQEDALRRDDILGAVGQLPDDQRSVLLLVSIEDVTYAEAARILDIPIGTVMSRLARARARLLKLLEEQRKPASDRPHLRRVQ